MDLTRLKALCTAPRNLAMISNIFMTSWYHKLYPGLENMTRGSLKHKVETLLKSNSLQLGETIESQNTPEGLSTQGLTRDILLGDPKDFIFEGLSTNELICEFEKFRSKEGLPNSFVTKWMVRLCPTFSDSQMRHKITVVLKKVKTLKARKKLEELSLYLSERVQDNDRNLTPVTREVNPDIVKKSCDCSQLRKRLKDLEKNSKLVEEYKTLLERKDLDLQEAHAKIYQLEKSKTSAKTLLLKLNAQKRSNAKKTALLSELQKSNLYRKNFELRKQLKRRSKEKKEIKEEMDDMKNKFEDESASQSETVNNLKKKLKSEQTMRARLSKQNLEKSLVISDLLEANQKEKTIILKEEKFNQFTNDVRLLYVSLMGDANVAAQNCNTVVQIVSKYLFKTTFSFDQLPSVSSILNFVSEASQLAQCQVVEKIKESNHFTFATDGTSRQKKHYLERHIVLDDKVSLSLGYTEIASDDSDTLLEKTVEVLDDLSQIYCSMSGQETDEIFKFIIRKMMSVMSDRAAVMKCYNKKLHEYKKDLLGEDECSTEFLFCNAHFLLGLVNSTEKAIKDIEKDLGKLGRDCDPRFQRFSNNECATFRVIRVASDVLGPRGDEKCGCREEWLAYCKSNNIKSKFTSFRTNRFNNLFENALAVIHHCDDILTFLNDYVSHSNLKLQSLTKDLQDNQLISLLAPIALFHIFFTGPYWQLMNSNVTYGQFPPFVINMKDMLNQWSNDFDDFDSMNSVFGDRFVINDEKIVTNMLTSLKYDKDLLKQSFNEISSQAYTVFQRQLADFLEGGVYGGEISQQTMEILNSSPLTNLTGERIFGDLDFDLYKRRHASLHLRTTLNMLKRNKTTSWLGKQTNEQKKKMFSVARKNAPLWKLRARQREEKEREKIRLKIVETMTKKKEKEIKKMEEKNKVLESIISHGGLCSTQEELNNLISGPRDLHKLKDQIRYRKIVLGEAIPLTANFTTLFHRLSEHLCSQKK